MANDNGFAGKFVPIDISFNGTDWIRFGAVRNKTISNSTETADSTADDSSGGFREVIETFIAQTLSWDGVIKADSRGVTLDRFEAFFFDPSNENDGDGNPLTVRCFYVRYARPKTLDETRTISQRVQLTSFEIGAAYDDVVTYSLEAQTIEAPTVADA
jgi:predicted secreted protein